jgi:hypothetical protein
VGVLLFGDREEVIFSIVDRVVGLVIYIVFFDLGFVSVMKRFDCEPWEVNIYPEVLPPGPLMWLLLKSLESDFY